MKEIFIPLNIEAMQSGGFLVTCENLPGLVVHGETRTEALQLAQDLIRKLVESYYDREELPPILQNFNYAENTEQWPDLPN